MSAVVRRWLRLVCSSCRERRIFLVKQGWVLECSHCGEQARLAANGLVTRTGARRPEPISA